MSGSPPSSGPVAGAEISKLQSSNLLPLSLPASTSHNSSSSSPSSWGDAEEAQGKEGAEEDLERRREIDAKMLSKLLRDEFKSQSIAEYLASYGGDGPSKKEQAKTAAATTTTTTATRTCNPADPRQTEAEGRALVEEAKEHTQKKRADPSTPANRSLSDGPSSEKRSCECQSLPPTANDSSTNATVPPTSALAISEGLTKKQIRQRAASTIQHNRSYISQLIEYRQHIGLSLPLFTFTSQGPSHAPLFLVHCQVDGIVYSADQPTSRVQAGKEKAALQALLSIHSMTA